MMVKEKLKIIEEENLKGRVNSYVITNSGHFIKNQDNKWIDHPHFFTDVASFYLDKDVPIITNRIDGMNILINFIGCSAVYFGSETNDKYAFLNGTLYINKKDLTKELLIKLKKFIDKAKNEENFNIDVFYCPLSSELNNSNYQEEQINLDDLIKSIKEKVIA